LGGGGVLCCVVGGGFLLADLTRILTLKGESTPATGKHDHLFTWKGGMLKIKRERSERATSRGSSRPPRGRGPQLRKKSRDGSPLKKPTGATPKGRGTFTSQRSAQFAKLSAPLAGPQIKAEQISATWGAAARSILSDLKRTSGSIIPIRKNCGQRPL